MGIFYIVLALIFAFLIVFIIVKIMAIRVPFCVQILDKLRAYLIFTAPIQYVITSYFRITGIFFSLLIVEIYKFDSEETQWTIIYGAVVGFFYVWPLLVICFLLKCRS